jgi:hypothetical protein
MCIYMDIYIYIMIIYIMVKLINGLKGFDERSPTGPKRTMGSSWTYPDGFESVYIYNMYTYI